MRLVAVTLLASGVLGATSASAGGAGAGAPAEGQLVDFELLPEVLTVEAGTTVAWTNQGERPHTLTDRGGMFDAGVVEPGDRAEVTFDVPGAYAIFCNINPGLMNATVVVEPGDDPPEAVRVQAFDEARQGESQRFDPAELEVEVGTELLLANVGGERHSLRADDGSFATPVLEPGVEADESLGEFASVELDTPGTFSFSCEVFPDTMRGIVEVLGEAVEETTTTEPEEPPDDPPPEEPDDEPEDDDGAEADDDEDDETAAPPPLGGGDPDGTLLAYALAALFALTAVVGLVLALRPRPAGPDPDPPPSPPPPASPPEATYF